MATAACRANLRQGVVCPGGGRAGGSQTSRLSVAGGLRAGGVAALASKGTAGRQPKLVRVRRNRVQRAVTIGAVWVPCDEGAGRGPRRGAIQTNTPSPPPGLSSIRWRRGSGCGFVALGASVAIGGFPSLQRVPEECGLSGNSSLRVCSKTPNSVVAADVRRLKSPGFCGPSRSRVRASLLGCYFSNGL